MNYEYVFYDNQFLNLNEYLLNAQIIIKANLNINKFSAKEIKALITLSFI